MKNIVLASLLAVLLASCSSTSNRTQSIKSSTPKKETLLTKKQADKPIKPTEDKSRIVVDTPQSKSDSFMYVPQQEVIDAGDDWYKLFNTWVMPNTDPADISMIRFPDGEESAYKGKKALIDGFERFCRLNDGELQDSRSDSSRKTCWVSEEENIGFLSVSPHKAPQYDITTEGDKYWSLIIRYNSNFHRNHFRKVSKSWERRKSEKVSGVIELTNGNKLDFINFGTIKENIAIEVQFGGYLSRDKYPIQDVAFIDFYKEFGCCNMGILMKNGRFRLLNSVHFLKRTAPYSTISFGIDGLDMVVKKGEKLEVINFSNLSGLKNISVGKENLATSTQVKKMREFHTTILAKNIKTKKTMAAERDAKKEEKSKIEHEKRMRQLKIEKQRDKNRRTAATAISEGEQICKTGVVSYQTCGSQRCKQHQTGGTLYGYVIDKFKNGFLEIVIGGIADIPERDLKMYRLAGKGAARFDGSLANDGRIISIDPLKVFKCNVTPNN